jgi:hypothetical protein
LTSVTSPEVVTINRALPGTPINLSWLIADVSAISFFED